MDLVTKWGHLSKEHKERNRRKSTSSTEENKGGEDHNDQRGKWCLFLSNAMRLLGNGVGIFKLMRLSFSVQLASGQLRSLSQ